MNISENEKKYLCQLARSELLKYFNQEKKIKEIKSATLLEKRPVFVTLKRLGELRGCIGRLKVDRSISDTVKDLVLESAFSDPRFYPLQEQELDDLIIEISILSDPKPLNNLSQFNIHQQGIKIEKKGRSALFLPEVAGELNWNQEKLFSELCLKAGLQSFDWKEGARLYTFESIKFS